MAFCNKCGKEIPEGERFCPECSATAQPRPETEQAEDRPSISAGAGTEPVAPAGGYPVEKTDKESFEDQPQKAEITSINLPKAKKSAKKYIILSAIIAVLIIAGVVAIFIIQNNRAEQIRKDYMDNLRIASLKMLSGAAEAESAGNLIRNVWYNTIYEKRDSETDKYTRDSYGRFNDDFNDSLTALFADSSFQSKINNIKDSKDAVTQLMKSLQNPPEEYKDAYIAIKAYYDSYLELTSLAISPSGSYNTFTSNFSQADSETVRCYEAMKMYLD